jgi:hypothetical protein
MLTLMGSTSVRKLNSILFFCILDLAKIIMHGSGSSELCIVSRFENLADLSYLLRLNIMSFKLIFTQK